MTAGENIASIALDMGSHPLYRAAYDQYTNALGIGAHDDFIYAARCAGEYAEAWELVHDKDFGSIVASAAVAVTIAAAVVAVRMAAAVAVGVVVGEEVWSGDRSQGRASC